MSQQHIDAMSAFRAAADRAVDLGDAFLSGDASLDEDDGSIASFDDARHKRPVSWAGMLGSARLMIQTTENLLAVVSAKPAGVSLKAHKQLLRVIGSTLEELKSALAAMEALPPPDHRPAEEAGENRSPHEFRHAAFERHREAP